MTATNLTLALERAYRTGALEPTMSLEAAKRTAQGFYVDENGYRKAPPLLSPPTANRKMAKSTTPAYGLTLAPASASGAWNTCTWSTPLCRSACVLMTAGKGTLPNVRAARVLKTTFLAEHPRAFVALLADEIRRAVVKHGAVVVRLNVASDLRWERFAPSLFDIDGATFYDYTKAPVSQRDNTYRLTYSVSEREHSTTNAIDALSQLANAAVVFERTDAGLPATWHGFEVIDGDVTDDRTEDKPGTVVGLLAKGAIRYAKGDDAGFLKPAVAS